MNRRDFLKATTGIAAGVALPTGTLPVDIAEPATAFGLSVLQQVEGFVKAQQAVNGFYYAFMHLRQFRDLLDIEARERWALAYRAFRVASRERFIEYDPRAVLRDFGRPKSGLLAGEMGLADGVTFIKTA